MTSSYPEQVDETAVCYRHHNRPTAVRCSNCDRPICADCMRSTPVGFPLPGVRAPTSNFALADDLLVTKLIVRANVIVFLAGIALQVKDGGSVGMYGFGSGNPLISDGALVTNQVADGEWYRSSHPVPPCRSAARRP